jgi:hypothetical protein
MQLVRLILTRHAKLRAPSAGIGLMLLTASAWGRADPLTNEQMAQSLFDRGRQLMDQQRYSEACPILDESQRLDPGGGTLLNLAMCHEGGGQLATAYTEYNQALSLAIRDAREDRIRLAKERLAALGPAVPRLTVRVSPDARVAGLKIALDGTALPESAWGQPMMVNPGEHRVHASAVNAGPWNSAMLVQRGDHRAFDIPILSAPVTIQMPSGPGDRTSAQPVGAAAAPEPRQRRSAGFYVLTAVGATAAVAGLYCLLFSIVGSSTESADSSDSLRTAMWVSFGVSAASFGVAFALPTVSVSVPTAPSVRSWGGLTLSARF